jgi:hypothetical protein
MKKILFLLSLLIFAVNANSQNYHKLIQPNKFWDIFCDNGFFYEYISKIYFTGNDTIIDGKQYSLSKSYPYQQINPGPLIPPFVIDSISYQTGFYLREDTIEKKVYIYNTSTPVGDQLMYDFSLNVGDTLMSDFNIGGDGTHLVLISIDSVVLQSGEFRRKFNYQDPMTRREGNYIEGIGGSQGIYLPIIPAFEQSYSYGYFCVNQDDVDLWGDQCNWYFVGTEKLTTNFIIKIYPNPASETIEIEVPLKYLNQDFQLYTIDGVLVKTIRLQFQNTRVALHGLNPGIYLYKIGDDSNICIGKLTIH